MSKELSVIGKGLPLKDARTMVTGGLKYAVDIGLDNMLHARILRSPHAHARIRRIDVSKAQSLAGVEAVITHKDVPQEEWSDHSLNYRGRVLDEKVRFVGDEVAAVAAADINIAAEALKLIEVDYEELPAVFDVKDAMKPDAPQVTPHGNVREPYIVEWGDVEAGFEEADLVVEHEAKTGSQQHAPLSYNACIASWEGDKLTVWTSTQKPYSFRDTLAQIFKMPQNKVRVVALPVGGSFGFWWVNRFNFFPVFLAKKAGRPVKLELTREEMFATVKRRESSVSWVRLGVKKDGSFVAIHFKNYLDNGAYGFKRTPYETVSDLWVRNAAHGKFELYGVSTNLVTGGCMRGVGSLEMNFAMEQVIDKAAEKLGMDPLKIRLKNHSRAGDQQRARSRAYEAVGVPFSGQTVSSSGLEECIKRGAKSIGWAGKWRGWGKPLEVSGPKRRGLGMAVGSHSCGHPGQGCPSVIVRVNHDGTVYLLTSVGRMGQGAETTQAQIVAEELGIPCENVVGIHGDTDACPRTPPTVGSINAHIVGLATQAAAADAKRQICELASKQLGTQPEDLDIKNGMIYVERQPERRIHITEVTNRIIPEFLSPPTIVGQAWKNIPQSPVARTYMAHFVEVEIDTETGKVKILRYVAVHDTGKIINPEVCENQISGGIIQGCGFALCEDVIFDHKTGEVLNPNYSDYKIFRALDIPDPEISFVEVIDPVGAFGVKGLGEGPICPVPAAIAQAIYNAIGIRFNETPITSEKLLRALKDRRKETEDTFGRKAGSLDI